VERVTGGAVSETDTVKTLIASKLSGLHGASWVRGEPIEANCLCWTAVV
jgi:hypothetical protein